MVGKSHYQEMRQDGLKVVRMYRDELIKSGTLVRRVLTLHYILWSRGIDFPEVDLSDFIDDWENEREKLKEEAWLPPGRSNQT